MLEPRTITLAVGGRSFDFQLCQRELLFGRAGVGQYFWMDGRKFRHGTGGPNFRPCVDLWWHVNELAGAAGDPTTEMNLVLAECYPLVNTAKAVQDVYIDAHLHPRADREHVYFEADQIRQRRSERTDTLPNEDVERLRSIAHSGDVNQVRLELEGLFRGPSPSPEEMPAHVEAAQAWIGNGIVALRREGRDGLKRYTQTVDEWLRRLRKRGNIDRVRMFLNMFSYECKVAFYYCYGNAWSGILPQLQQMGELNSLGERFMRLWYHQNQPPEGAEVHRDIFSGQIPALHPLSAIILTSPQHLEVIGRYIGRPDFSELQASGTYLENKEYRDMVTTILVAAHEYDRSRRRWEDQRGQGTPGAREAANERHRDDGAASAKILFENYTDRRRKSCSKCSGALSYVRHELLDDVDSPTVLAYFRCQECKQERQLKIKQSDLELTNRVSPGSLL